MNSHRLLWLLVGSVGILLTGCAAVLVAGGAAAGAGSVLYVRGALEATVDNPYDEVWQASLDAMDQLGLRVIAKDKKATKGVIKSHLLDGKPLTIEIHPRTRRITDLSIRVGTFGDQDLSLDILNAIQKQLPA